MRGETERVICDTAGVQVEVRGKKCGGTHGCCHAGLTPGQVRVSGRSIIRCEALEQESEAAALAAEREVKRFARLPMGEGGDQGFEDMVG